MKNKTGLNDGEQRDLYNYCFRTNANPTTLDVVQILRTTQACFGGWTHKTWLKVNGKRMLICNGQSNSTDLELLTKEGYPTPLLVNSNRRIFVHLKQPTPVTTV